MIPKRRNPASTVISDGPHLDEVLDFMRTLWAVDHGLRSLSKDMRNCLGVTGPQRLVLRMLERFPASKPGDLSVLLHLDPSTLTGILKRLEHRRLLSRIPDPTDGRSAQLRLTARGGAFSPPRRGTVEDSVRRTLAKLPPWKIEAAKQVLQSLADDLQNTVAQRKGKRV
ncbi:MAG: MarR family transcriptional regulator [Candidatus Zixiibacteriota bacterium]